jgi:hypothetical protein
VSVSVKQILVFGRTGSKWSCIPETHADSSDLDLGNVIPGYILEMIKSYGNKDDLDLKGINL